MSEGAREASSQQSLGTGNDGHSGPDAAPAPSEKKRTRCQEKNRRAQARFREKQKAKAIETEKKLADLEAAVSQLQGERLTLQSHARALEAQLQHKQQQQQHVALPQVQATLVAAAPAHSGQNGRADYNTWLAQTHSTGSAGFEVVLQTVTPMAWDSYVVFYKDQIHRMAPLLAAAQADPHGQEAQTCERLLNELSEANRAIFHRSPALRDKVHTQPLVDASEEPTIQPDVNLWRQVTAALQMAPAQVRRARELHTYYWSRMRAIMSERKRLSMAMLSTTDLPADIEVPAAGHWQWNRDVASKHTQALEAITGLNKNIAEETLAQIEVGHGLFCKVLTPLQACSAYVGLYPFFPDKLAILSCVLELEDPEDAVRSLVSELVGGS